MTMPAREHRPHIRAAIKAWLSLAERRQADDIAWAAGLFDGEGSIGTQQSDPRYRQRVVLRLVMTSRDGVERFHRIFPFSPIKTAPARWHRLPCYVWSCTHIGYVGYVLLMLQSHLTVKRKEAWLAIGYLGIADQTAAQSRKFVELLRAGKSKPGPRRRGKRK